MAESASEKAPLATTAGTFHTNQRWPFGHEGKSGHEDLSRWSRELREKSEAPEKAFLEDIPALTAAWRSFHIYSPSL